MHLHTTRSVHNIHNLGIYIPDPWLSLRPQPWSHSLCWIVYVSLLLSCLFTNNTHTMYTPLIMLAIVVQANSIKPFISRKLAAYTSSSYTLHHACVSWNKRSWFNLEKKSSSHLGSNSGVLSTNGFCKWRHWHVIIPPVCLWRGWGHACAVHTTAVLMSIYLRSQSVWALWGAPPLCQPLV